MLMAMSDMKDLALQVTTDDDQKFELALSLDDLEQAISIIESSTPVSSGSKGAPSSGNEVKWQTLGDKALSLWKITLAEKCYQRSGDLSGLLLIYSSLNDASGLSRVGQAAFDAGQYNVSFNAYLQVNDLQKCVEILLKTDRIPEAALFARSYVPSEAGRVVKVWKKDLEEKKKQKIAVGLADPDESEERELFNGWEEALQREKQNGSGYEENVPALKNGNGHAQTFAAHQHQDEVDLLGEQVDSVQLGSGSQSRAAYSNGANDEEDDDDLL